MSFKKATLILITIVVLLGIAFILDSYQVEEVEVIDSFEDCMEAGYPIMESYPRQCRTPDGRNFVEDIGDDDNVVCTMDAKQCPDGSYVGRVGPNCEFAPCPGETNGNDNDDLRAPGAYDGCVITGCSSQVCADEEVATTCEYLPEYACYREAVCERQADGECGWTEDSNLNSCLDSSQ